MLSSDVKFQDRVSFCNTAKLLFGTNHAIRTPNEDEAFFNRMVVVPFGNSIRKQDQNPHLPDLLIAERDSIIVQALRAYLKLRERGYCFAGDYQVDAVCGLDGEETVDKVANFLENFCKIEPAAWTSGDCLFTAFVETYGNCCGRNSFSATLIKLCQTRKLSVRHDRNRLTSSGNPIWGFRGLKLKEEVNEQL